MPPAAPPSIPTQTSPHGLRYDFNNGLRLMLPQGNWRVDILDDSSGVLLHTCQVKGDWVISPWKYFIPYGIQVTDLNSGALVLNTALHLNKQSVLVRCSPSSGLGDLIAWMPVIDAFGKKHGCHVVCSMDHGPVRELLQQAFPHIECIGSEQIGRYSCYATYLLGIFEEDAVCYHPIDYKKISIQQIAGDILGVDTPELVPQIGRETKRQVAEKYACIAVQSTGRAKLWNNASGWAEVVQFLRSKNLRVLCIDQSAHLDYSGHRNRIPAGAEDWTGNKPLLERVALLRHAEVFVGLGSGLSWLAWACGTPVVLISGFSWPSTEFYTPGRVFNPYVCNGCWNARGMELSSRFPDQCAENRQFVCTSSITGKQVIRKIAALLPDTVPACG